MSADTPPAPRLTLRQLPLPAKLVLTTFLLAVGLGYSSAMIQLHMQHSDRDGTTLPTVENVVAVFAGKVYKKEGDERIVSHLEAIISGDPAGGINGANMAPAFFARDEANYSKQAKDPAKKPKLDLEREGERKAFVAWINAPPEVREQAYDGNHFALPKGLEKLVVTPAYLKQGQPGTVHVRELIRDRCTRCHRPGGEKGDVPLTTYAELEKYMPPTAVIPPGGGYVDSGRLMSLEKLTQSTHAHLLSFAVLFSLTGLIFAYTGLPGIVRGTVGPIVLVAQVADISCWWLARLPEPYGVNFAKAIIGTGGVVGLGLAAHIVLSLFSMYGSLGKVVLLLLFAAAAGGGAAGWEKVVKPHLEAEKAAAVKKAEDAKKRADDDRAKAGKKAEGPAKVEPVPAPPKTGPSGLERVLTGQWAKTWVKDGPWAKDGKVPDGGMVRAFFDKEGDFKAALKDDPAAAEKLVPLREGERAALLAWAKAAADVRKKGYDDNAFPLPEAVAGRPTPEFLDKDGKHLKVRDLIEARCSSCHAADANVPLDSYAGLEKWLAPAAAPARGAAAIPPARE